MARCPYSPQHNSTALITSNGELYAATAMDFPGRDPAIYRSLGGLPPLRTAQYNSKWLNEPNIVSSYDIGNFIYFFFRENAVEHDCGKTVFSRAARVCKNDIGGRFLLEDTWTTFTKSRLNCSRPGEIPFYYNELQGTFFLPELELLYGIFTTNVNSIAASAVCVFNLSAVTQVFNGPFKYQENSRSAWLPYPNPNPDFQCVKAPASQCFATVKTLGFMRGLFFKVPMTGYVTGRAVCYTALTDSDPSCGTIDYGVYMNLTERNLQDAQKFILMHEVVQPVTPIPYFMEDNSRFSHIVVDVVQGKDMLFHIIYLATDYGTIKKVLSPLNNSMSSCLLDEIELFPSGQRQPIRSLQILHSQSILFVGLWDQVIKIPLMHCTFYKTHSACVGARDPYCGWDLVLKKCTTLDESLSMSQWEQSITECPSMNMTIDGHYGAWSLWKPCSHTDGNSVGSCHCRTRSCDSPAPQCGGQLCEGPSMEVANCSRYCNEHLPCPPHVYWSSWGSWERCTALCGGGVQARHRTCENGNECPGCSLEYQSCNTVSCPEMKKTTPWTPWTPVNISDNGGHYEQRFRYTCKARLADPSLLEVGRQRIEMRYCSSDGTTGCSTDVKMHSFLHVRLGSLPRLTSSGMDELVFLEQPQDNGGDSPCVLHLQCTSQGGCEIAFLQVVSEARIIEVYSDTEYCGTCRGEKVSSLQINGVNESISLYKKRVHLECPVTSCEVKLLSLGRKNRVGVNNVLLGVKPVKKLASFPSGGTSIDLERVQTMVESMGTKLSPGAQHLMDMVQFQQKNQQDNLGGCLGLLMGNRQFAALGKENAGSRPTPDINARGFLGLLMGNRQFAALGKENAGSRPTPYINAQTAEDFELAGGSLDHNSASSLEAEVTAGGVLTTENLEHPFGVDNGVPPANQITDMVSSYLRNQTKQKQNTISVDMLPFLQSVCGQVKQLRIEDGAQKSEAVQRSKPGPELEKEHVCCSSLEKVLVKQMEMMEKRLMHCIDQRLNALEDSLERKVQSALDVVRRADGPNTVKQDCGCHGALVNGNA
ncbi:UNVERIFIED_CONTAM: hypothetical protein FKN15_003134 [Acipenser sinensis]